MIEINKFKHLCHLSLKFTAGNDNDVKKYLANCLVGLRKDIDKLTQTYEDTKTQLAQKTIENEQLQKKLDGHVQKTEQMVDKENDDKPKERDDQPGQGNGPRRPRRRRNCLIS